MKTLGIILQFGVSMTESLSMGQVIFLWSSITFCVVLFIILLIRTERFVSKKNNAGETNQKSSTAGRYVTDEEAAAIAMAINMYKRDLHDMESFTITLKKVSRIYSPWSSKIYTLRQNPK